MLKKIILSSLLMIMTFGLFGQQNITGLWRGYNTQEAAGTYSSKYEFELYIKTKEGRVWGRSYAFIDNLFAEMEIEGTWDGSTLLFQEVKIVKFKADNGMEWCVKKGELKLIMGEEIRLEGIWSGTTSFSNCIPGKVFLRKITPRA